MTEQILSSRSFHNHIKLGLGFLFTREVLEEFVREDTEEFKTRILDDIYTNGSAPSGNLCHACLTPNVLQCPTKDTCGSTASKCPFHTSTAHSFRTCPNGICSKFKDRIKAEHRSEPVWRNTDASKWCSSVVEVAKCFMPPNGYEDTADLNETDFHGIISIIINNKRFQNKLGIFLSQKENLCIRVRQINNEFRHSANLSMEDNTLVERLDLLITLLQDPKYLALKTQDAIETLQKLKTDTFEISPTQVRIVLSDVIKDREHAAIKNISEHEQLILQLVHDLQARYREEVKAVTASSLAEVIDTKVSALLELTECGRRQKAGIARAGNREQRKLQRTATQLKRSFEKEDIQEEEVDSVQRERSKQTDHQLKQELRDELIEFYKVEHKHLPISPLIDTNQAPLLEFYVGPTMYNIDIDKQPFRNEESKFTQPVKSYRDIFFKDGKRCKNIYLTSRAGRGKTCFSKRMTLAWCQALKPEDSERERFEIENIEAMKEFSFVFLISLRECLSRECDVDEIIQKQLIDKLSGGFGYTKIMPSLLHSDDCLIVIDGLDEWSHPTKKKKRCNEFRSKIPHQKFRAHSTILTTSRRWKFHTISQNKVQVDQHVEMMGLDNESAQMLAKNVISHLNLRSKQSKSEDDFKGMLESKGLLKFIHVPLILMQLLSLWYDGKEPGESKCQIFSNMLELLFRHAKRRSNFFDEKFKNIPHKKGKRSNKTLPGSFGAAQLCQKYKQVLNSLSKLAYETMFGENFDNTLVFDHNIAKIYLSQDEFSLCLETGILLQSKESGKLTSEELNYSFLHKSFQELLAALFVSSKSDIPKNMLPKIMKKIKSVDEILHMDMFLIFLSGFSSAMIKSLSEEFVALISKEEMTERYRRNIGTIFIKDHDKMHELSDLMVSCLQESNSNGLHAEVYLEDIFIDQKCTDRKFRDAASKIIAFNQDTMKSLYVQVHQTVNTDLIDEMMKEINIDTIHALEKLFVWGNIQAPNVKSLLTNSSGSMKCLELWHQTLDEDHIEILGRMNNVSGFSLLSITMPHSQIVNLMAYLSSNELLEQLNLNDIECTDHGEKCPGYQLEVCSKSKPRLFLLDKLHVTNVSVNAEDIQMCVAEWLFKDEALDSLLTCLKTAASLKRFECDDPACDKDTNSLITSVPLFENLSYFRLSNVKLSGSNLNLSNMKDLMRVHIWHASMTADVFKGIVNDVESLGKSVIVILDDCNINPAEEENGVREYVKTCGKFEVIKEALGKYRQFHFKSMPR